MKLSIGQSVFIFTTPNHMILSFKVLFFKCKIFIYLFCSHSIHNPLYKYCYTGVDTIHV